MVVRDGSVLTVLVATDIGAGDGVESSFTIDDICRIARTAAGHICSSIVAIGSGVEAPVTVVTTRRRHTGSAGDQES